MRLKQFLEQQSLISPSEIDKKGKERKLPNAYDNINYGQKGKVKQQTITVTDKKSKGKPDRIYGRRTFHDKVVESTQLNEGGNIFKGQDNQPVTQRIDKQNVDPTLQWLEQITGLPLIDNKLGTTGQKATSGDLDVAVDQNQVSKNDLTTSLKQWVREKLPDQDPNQWVKKSGDSVHFKTPINGNVDQGFVQTDFMFGDPEWMKFSLQGTSADDSPFKGKHRHILMNSVAKAHGLKWSHKHGLISRKTGNVVTDHPKHIARILLGDDATPQDLSSVESILDKIRNDPEYENLVADARDAFSKEGLQLPGKTDESLSLLKTFYYREE